MPLVKLQFASGIQSDISGLSAMGGWVDSDKVRFFKAVADKPSFPKKIGGWRKYTTNTYQGECCSLHTWYDLASDRFLGVETNLKAYVESSGVLTDITPIRRTASLGANPFLPVGGGSSMVTVHDVGHGAQVNDFVTFSGATGGQIAAGDINLEFQITNIVDADNYEINTNTTVSGAGVAFGGGAVTAKYQIHVGVTVQLAGTGYGTGTYGRGTYGSAYSTSNYLFRVWSQDNFGENLLLLPNYDQLYVWDPTSGLTNNPAVAVSSLAGANSVPTAALLVFVTDERHVVLLGAQDFGTDGQDPMVVRWSAQEDYLDWEPRTDNTAGSYRLSLGSTIVAYVKTQSTQLIWTDKGVYTMTFIGPPYTFSFQLASGDLSIIGPRAGVSARNSIYWMDTNNFFMYNGAVVPLQCPVLNHIFSDFNYSQRYKVAGALNSQFNEITWYYPSASSQVNDKYVTLNFLTGEWWVGNLSREGWADLSLDGLPVGAYSGSLYQHEYGTDADGEPMVAWIESGDTDIMSGQEFAFVKRIIPDFEFTGSDPQVQVILKGRDFPDNSLREKANVTVLPGTSERHVRMRDRQTVVRIESDGLGCGWQLGTLRLDVQQDGRR